MEDIFLPLEECHNNVVDILSIMMVQPSELGISCGQQTTGAAVLVSRTIAGGCISSKGGLQH